MGALIKKKMVSQAIQALRDLNKQYYEDASKKKPLLEDEEKSTLFLQVMLKKIPESRLIKMIKVNLPHPLIKDTDEVCLIAGDLNKNDRKAEIEPDILHYKTLLDKHHVTHISEVLTLRQLRTEYKPYEAKQKLLAAYDVFLADNRINECLPKVLGKHFFKKRKFPIQIDLKTSNLKHQIEKALSTKVFYITGQGNCCTSEVAYLDMADSEILDNVMAMYKTLSEELPGTWDNVMGIYLRTARSKSIPLYMCFDVELIDGADKKKKSKKAAQKNVHDAFEGNPDSIQIKRQEEKHKNAVENAHIISGENVELIDGADKRKKSKKKAQKNVHDAFEGNPDSIQRKRKEEKHKNAVENAHIISGENEFSEGIKKSAFKRKRALSESVILDSKESVGSKETPVHTKKKRKIEGINMKRYQSMKESRRGNKRKNQQRAKQT